MKFVVEHVSKSGGRLGRLRGLRSQPGTTHTTPLSLITTIGGSAPHLTQDVLHLVAGREAPLCVPAQHFCQHVKVLQDFKKGVAHFAALQSHSVGVVVQDPTKVTPSGYNDKQGVSTWTYGGRHILNAQTYMRLVEAMQPDWYEALSDADTPLGASKKRVSKSLAQSKVYVSACLQHHKKSQALQGCGLLVPLLGGHSQAERARWSQGVCQWVEEGAGVCGYVVQGLHTSGPEVERLTPGHVTELVRTSLECLPEGGVVQAGGSWSPALVVSLVELGVDMFDSSFPHLVTQRNGALTFPHHPHRGHACQEAEGVASFEHLDKKLKLCVEEQLQHEGERQPEGEEQREKKKPEGEKQREKKQPEGEKQREKKQPEEEKQREKKQPEEEKQREKKQPEGEKQREKKQPEGEKQREKKQPEGEEQREQKQQKEEHLEETRKKVEVSHKKNGDNGEQVQEDNGKQSSTSVYEICLQDKSHALDQGPLLDGCECYTCRHFTRAYIHHLINVREMLAPVLLMIHNLHHWTGFFSSIREAVRTDRLQDLKAVLSSLAKE